MSHFPPNVYSSTTVLYSWSSENWGSWGGERGNGESLLAKGEGNQTELSLCKVSLTRGLMDYSDVRIHFCQVPIPSESDFENRKEGENKIDFSMCQWNSRVNRTRLRNAIPYIAQFPSIHQVLKLFKYIRRLFKMLAKLKIHLKRQIARAPKSRFVGSPGFSTGLLDWNDPYH